VDPEWAKFKELLEAAYTKELEKMKLILQLVPFENIDFAECRSVARLSKFLQKQVDEDTSVIVAACPAHKSDEVEQVILDFKEAHKALKANLNLAYPKKEQRAPPRPTRGPGTR